jgi:hypothetical protein
MIVSSIAFNYTVWHDKRCYFSKSRQKKNFQETKTLLNLVSEVFLFWQLQNVLKIRSEEELLKFCLKKNGAQQFKEILDAGMCQ